MKKTLWPSKETIKQRSGWIGGIVIGAIIALVVTEMYSEWSDSSELDDLEDRLYEEIAANLEVIDRKMWGLEPLGSYPDPGQTKLGDVNKFKVIAGMPYSQNVFLASRGMIFELESADRVQRFNSWIDDSAKMQFKLAGKYKRSESDVYFDRERKFLASIFAIQRQGLYLYVYGCSLVAHLTECRSKLDRIQKEFRILKNTDRSIKDLPMEKLEEYLEGWSGEINAV